MRSSLVARFPRMTKTLSPSRRLKKSWCGSLPANITPPMRSSMARWRCFAANVTKSSSKPSPWLYGVYRAAAFTRGKMKKAFELGFYVTFGAGIAFGISSFTILSELFKVASSLWMVVSISLAGLVCMLISTSIAELASMYPSSPGVRTYLKVALPARTSLFLVYLYLMFMIMVAGIESYLFALVVRQLFPNIPPLVLVLSLLAATVIVNLLGLELPRGVQMFTTAALILSVLCLGIAGASTHLGNLHWNSSVLSDHPLSQIGDALGAAVYLFIGFEWVTMMGFTAKAYERKIPISMPLAILTNIVAYCIFSLALATRLPVKDITATAIPQLPYFVHIFGPRGSIVGLVLSVLAI